MSNKSLGLLIRKLRKEKRLSLRKLAEKVDVSFVNIAHIENGRITTSRDVLVQLAEALDYNVDELLAIGEQVGNDVEKIIRNKADIVPDFLRSTKNLSKNDWKELSKIVKKMNKKNG